MGGFPWDPMSYLYTHPFRRTRTGTTEGDHRRRAAIALCDLCGLTLRGLWDAVKGSSPLGCHKSAEIGFRIRYEPASSHKGVLDQTLPSP